MVSRITLLEPHFEGAQFGPSNVESDAFDGIRGLGSDEPGTDERSSGPKSRGTMLVQGLIGFVLLAVVLYASLRVLSSDDSE